MLEPFVGPACAAAFFIVLVPPAEPGATLFDAPSRVVARRREIHRRATPEVGPARQSCRPYFTLHPSLVTSAVSSPPDAWPIEAPTGAPFEARFSCSRPAPNAPMAPSSSRMGGSERQGGFEEREGRSPPRPDPARARPPPRARPLPARRKGGGPL